MAMLLPERLDAFIDHTGSVIQLLQQTFNENITVQCIGQGINRTSPVIWKDIDPEEDLLIRTVYLNGEDSGRRYVYATSYMRIGYLPKALVDELLNNDIGIGELLAEYALATERQVIEKRSVDNALVRCVFPEESTIIERHYKIYHQQTPIIFISEYYPQSLYQ